MTLLLYFYCLQYMCLCDMISIKYIFHSILNKNEQILILKYKYLSIGHKGILIKKYYPFIHEMIIFSGKRRSFYCTFAVKLIRK